MTCNRTNAVPREMWIWRGFRMELPPDWEMLQFSRNPEKGRCAFADRYRWRLEFNWRRVPGPPDFDRMISDYRARLETSPHVAVTERPAGHWRGLDLRQKVGSTTRFGAYFGHTGCLVELVFLWPGEPEEALEQAILAHFAPEPDTPAGKRRWRAFGLDIDVPAAFSFQQCLVQPAMAHLIFAGPRSPERWSFRRLGFVPRWLNLPVGEWLLAQSAGRVTHPCRTAFDCAGHHVETVEGEFTPRRFFQTRGLYDAAAWICPRDRRLYHVERTHARTAPATPSPAQQVLRCCETWSQCS